MRRCSEREGVKAPPGRCFTDLILDKGRDNNTYPVLVSFWDVDNGGATGGANRTEPLGSHWVTLSAQIGPMGPGCIEDILLRHTQWDIEAKSGVSEDYQAVAYWDVGDWGSVETKHPGVYAGSDRATLFIKRVKEAPGASVVTHILPMRVNFTVPATAGISAAFDQARASYFKTNQNIGFWSVDRDGVCVAIDRCTPSASKGGNGNITPAYAGLQVLKSPYVKAQAAKATAATVSGKWVMVSECAAIAGAQCGESRNEITVGVEEGKELGSSSTIGASLSLMVGAEVKGTTGALPGGEVTARFEATGTVSAETQRAITDSFTRTRTSLASTACTGEASKWQWVSTLVATFPSGVDEVVTAPSNMTRCAPPGAVPPDPSDINWGRPHGAHAQTLDAGGFTHGVQGVAQRGE